MTIRSTIPSWLLLGVLCALVLLVDGSWNAVYAQQSTSPFSLQCISMPALQGAVSAKAVVCMRELLEQSVHLIVAKVAAFMLPIGFSVIALAFTLYGLRLTFGGERHPVGAAVMMVMKAGFIILILTEMSNSNSSSPFNISHLALDVQDEVMGYVDTAFKAVLSAPGASSAVLLECVRNGGSPGTTNVAVPHSTVVMDVSTWNSLDCLLGLLAGSVRGVAHEVGLFSFVMALFFSGAFGIMAFFMVANLVLSMFGMLVRSVFMLMFAYLSIAIILMFVPLVVPLIMFRHTMSYFNKWIAMYLGIIFQPVILKIYTAFAVVAISMFVVGQLSLDKNNKVIKSDLTTSPPHVYSVWQVLMFDQITDVGLRKELMSSMVKSNCKTMLNLQGTVTAAAELLAAGWNNVKAFVQGNHTDMMSVTMGFDCIYVGAESGFEQKLKDLKNRNKGDFATYEYEVDANGKEVLDANGQKVIKLDSNNNKILHAMHPLYSGGRFDDDFNTWFLRALLMALVGAAIMVFVINELNKSIPDIARTITGQAAIMLTSGMSKIVSSNDPAAHSRKTAGAEGSAIPFEGRIEALFERTEERWSATMSEAGYNPFKRAVAFVRGGVEGVGGAAWDQGKETTLGDMFNSRFKKRD